MIKFDIAIGDFNPPDEPRVGNVYTVKGGRGLKNGYMQVLLAITEPKDQYDSPQALLMIIDKEGRPRGVTHYGLHYIREQMPIAFVDGIDDLEFTVRSL